MRLARRRLFAGAAAALILAACTKIPPPSAVSAGFAQHAGVLRVAVQRSPNTLNPLLASNTTEGFVDRLTSDLLVSVAADGKTRVPELAAVVPTLANGGISRDGLTITYHLRRGVRWQDGAPFTSHDVKFSWQAMMNPDNDVNEQTGYDVVRTVDTPDDFTVVFHLKHRYAPFVDTVFGESDNAIEIVPEHLLAAYPNVNQIPFNQHPIGTGPFKVVDWVHGDHITLVRNDDYWGGKPKLREIIIREIPDENTEVNELRAHDIDWMFEPSPDTYTMLKRIPGIKIVLQTGPQTLKIQMNELRPPLNDVRVRRALEMAIDKAGIVRKFTGGSAIVAWADQPPYSYDYDPDVTKWRFDPPAARALLARAGWRPGSDGVLRKSGRPLTLEISYNVENVTRRMIAVEVQAELHRIGIQAVIKAYPANLFFATYGQGGITETGKFDLDVIGWIAGIDPDDDTLFDCAQIPTAAHPYGNNVERYCNPKMDALQHEALSNYDPAARKRAYDGIQELIARDVPVDYIFFTRFPQAIDPAFKGFAPNPVEEAWNAKDWSI